MDFNWNLTVESFIIIGKAYWDGGIYKMLHREEMPRTYQKNESFPDVLYQDRRVLL